MIYKLIHKFIAFPHTDRWVWGEWSVGKVLVSQQDDLSSTLSTYVNMLGVLERFCDPSTGRQTGDSLVLSG